MLYPIYQAIKAQLQLADTTNSIKAIEWYNVQYESTIASTPRVFIEFPEALPFALQTKDRMRAPLKIRIHVVTQAITSSDGTINDTIAQDHENTALLALNAIEQFKPASEGVPLCPCLHLSAWQHWHKHKGWMVTFVEFDSFKYL